MKSAENLRSTKDPPEHLLGQSVISRAVPTTTYHSEALRDENVHTARLQFSLNLLTQVRLLLQQT